MNDVEKRQVLLGEIDELVRKRDRRRITLDALNEQLRAAIVSGHLLGVPKLTLSRRAKVSRQTVYDMLKAYEGGEGA